MTFRLTYYISILVSGLLLCGGGPEHPKNIIILIGDGMGINHVATSLLTMPESPFRFFPHTGYSITTSAYKLLTDSGAGATALATGHRTKNRYIGLDSAGQPLQTLMEKADDCGLATGVVVTSSITHATPAAFLSHIIDRGREYEIAMQYPLRQWDLLIGGGRKFFESRVDTVTNTWTAGLLPELAELEYDLYYSYDSLAAHPPKRKFYALLEREELPPALQRNYRLEQLTNLAVNHLKARETGFVLMVEGSQIDWACHDNKVEDFFAEMKDFSEAVRAAYEFARDDGNTLVLVTADHETGGMAITGGSSDGTNLKISFISKSHTGGVVGVFAYGPGAEQFGGILENYQIGQRLLRFLPSGTLKAAQ